jgi:hypothetical protein
MNSTKSPKSPTKSAKPKARTKSAKPKAPTKSQKAMKRGGGDFPSAEEAEEILFTNNFGEELENSEKRKNTTIECASIYRQARQQYPYISIDLYEDTVDFIYWIDPEMDGVDLLKVVKKHESDTYVFPYVFLQQDELPLEYNEKAENILTKTDIDDDGYYKISNIKSVSYNEKLKRLTINKNHIRTPEEQEKIFLKIASEKKILNYYEKDSLSQFNKWKALSETDKAKKGSDTVKSLNDMRSQSSETREKYETKLLKHKKLGPLAVQTLALSIKLEDEIYTYTNLISLYNLETTFTNWEKLTMNDKAEKEAEINVIQKNFNSQIGNNVSMNQLKFQLVRIKPKIDEFNLRLKNDYLNHQGGSKSVIRHYVVVRASLGKIGGRYASNAGPSAAAKKAASNRFGSKNKMRITVRQTGSDREFTYDATREKLAKPVVRRITGVMVTTSEYRVLVKAVAKK